MEETKKLLTKKKDYSASKRKIQVINDVMDLNSCKRLVGLAGPNPLECIKRWRAKGAEEIVIYENNIDTFIHQRKLLKNMDIRLCNIMDVPYQKGTFYDLDFCCHLQSLEGDLAKFEENFMFTFAMRNRKGFNKGDIMDEFFERRGEKVLGDYETDYHFLNNYQREVVTDKGIYHVTTYRDGMPMITFYKLKTEEDKGYEIG